MIVCNHDIIGRTCYLNRVSGSPFALASVCENVNRIIQNADIIQLIQVQGVQEIGCAFWSVEILNSDVVAAYCGIVTCINQDGR